jgi:hypothetical protein
MMILETLYGNDTGKERPRIAAIGVHFMFVNFDLLPLIVT